MWHITHLFIVLNSMRERERGRKRIMKRTILKTGTRTQDQRSPYPRGRCSRFMRKGWHDTSFFYSLHSQSSMLILVRGTQTNRKGQTSITSVAFIIHRTWSGSREAASSHGHTLTTQNTHLLVSSRTGRRFSFLHHGSQQNSCDGPARFASAIEMIWIDCNRTEQNRMVNPTSPTHVYI